MAKRKVKKYNSYDWAGIMVTLFVSCTLILIILKGVGFSMSWWTVLAPMFIFLGLMILANILNFIGYFGGYQL